MKGSSLVRLFLGAACLSGASISRSEDGEVRDAFALVRELGSEEFRTRQAAAVGLLGMGWKAREAVRGALDSDDPEVKVQAAEIWRRLRWKLYPDISDETVGLMDRILEAEENPFTLWEQVVEINGARTLGLMVALLEDSDVNVEALGSGFGILLRAVEVPELSEAISSLPKTAVRKFMGEVRANLEMGEDEKLKMMQLCMGMEMFEAAVEYGSDAWWARRDEKTLEVVKDAILKGELEGKIWEIARSLLAGEEEWDHPWEICFYMRLAREFDRPEVVPELLEARAKLTNDPAVLTFLHGELSQMKLAHLVAGDLLASENAELIYLGHLTLKEGGRDEEAEVAWVKALRSLKEESECYKLGEAMGKRDDPRREEVWKRILEMEPENSVYDANARFRLATIFEKQGKFGEAADMQELGLRHMVGAILMTTPDGRSISGDEAKNLVLADIERLREKAKE